MPAEEQDDQERGPASLSFADAKRCDDLERGALVIRKVKVGKPQKFIAPPKDRPWKLAVAGGVLALFWSIFVFPFAGRIGTPVTFVICLAMIIAFGTVFFVIAVRHRQRWWRQLTQLRYKVCTDCHYNLKAHKDDGVCPECGSGTIEDLERIWHRRMRFEE